MRFLLEIEHHGERICGSVATDGRPPIPFDGWLELIGLLEDRTTDEEETHP